MNFKYYNKRYFASSFMIPPEKYIEALKKIYKYNQSKTKSLKEFKRLALLEAKKACTALVNLYSKKSRYQVILSKSLTTELLKSIHDTAHKLFVKINQNYKNERRKVYNNNIEYMNIIKKYELNKLKLFKHIVKSICKNTKISYENLQTSVFYYLEKNDNDIVDIINNTKNIGKSNYVIAPNKISTIEIVDILNKYYENLQYIINNAVSNSDNANNTINYNNNSNACLIRYSLVIVSDIIYEYYGLEEEQIYEAIKINTNICTDKTVNQKLLSIKNIISNNLSSIFEL